ncbi:MAG: type II toxin-antitoxin system ParD family antitoxin [Alphaproteobacteria bacterium]|jgi:antitoxin ParD1/3/4|nr:type II toxin-antitoxin system ParD family antitoxin [Alphaproteobacteria bacterium]
MNERTSLVLSAEQQDMVDRLVKTGRFRGTGEVVDAGLRLLDAEESKRAALRDAIRDGEESGPAEPFDLDTFLREVRDKTGANG